MNTEGSQWGAEWDAEPNTCLETPSPPLDLPPDFTLELGSESDQLVLDRIEVRPAVPPPDPKKR